MRNSITNLDPRQSISLQNYMNKDRYRGKSEPPLRGLCLDALDPSPLHESESGSDLVDVLVELSEREGDGVRVAFDDLQPRELVDRVTELFWSCSVVPSTIGRILKVPSVIKIHTKKRSVPHLDGVRTAVRLVDQQSGRLVEEDGTGVCVGIVDSGFDLSHPAFRDGRGKLRVEALLDQLDNNREYAASELEDRSPSGLTPADEDGHGTHVASIAAGSRFLGYEGIAPGARLILVRSDFRNIDRALAWIFAKAGDRPCVANLSLGHHYGPHDGTTAEERVIERLAGPGRIVVASAGNECERRMHVGKWFYPGLIERATFDIYRRRNGAPSAIFTCWHDEADTFEGSLITPFGDRVEFPNIGKRSDYDGSRTHLTLARNQYAPRAGTLSADRVRLVQTQVQIELSPTVRDADLQGWILELNCVRAAVGRFDGWFHSDGFATFRDGSLLDQARTIGMPATGRAVIAVGSFVSKSSWESDDGQMSDPSALIGHISAFSSMGPTRDGRAKPDVAAPGQYVTAALARGSVMERWSERARVGDRSLALEGTSMSAPVVTGLVALMLQRQSALTPDKVMNLLGKTAVRDAHTGFGVWSPSYGCGKLDIRSALSELSL